MTTFVYILLALVVLLVMITVHEFGHYCAGKIFGFKINEFSIGFGPALYKKTKKDGEVFAVRWLPLGGFCAFEGEDEDGEDADGKPNPEAFNNKPGWKRLIVLLSGVAFNFLFGVLTAAIYLMVTGYSTMQITHTVTQQGVTTMGFKENDIVVAVNGKTVEAYRSFSDMLKKFEEGEEFVVTVERDGQIVDITSKKQNFKPYYFVSYEYGLKTNLYTKVDENYVAITDEEFELLVKNIMISSTATENDDIKGKGYALRETLSNYYYKLGADDYKVCSDDSIISLLINGDESKEIYSCITYSKGGVGVGLIQTQVAKDYGFFESIAKAWPFCFYLCGLILSALGGLFTGATALKDMGGTVTAVSQIAEISQMGISYFLLLLPLLAMNLAVFNVLPVPSLDGARAVFVLIEMIFRKPVNRKIEGWIHTVGLFALLALVVFFDIYHFAVAARLLI